MGKIIKLTESDLVKIVKKTILEQKSQDIESCIDSSIKNIGVVPKKTKNYGGTIEYTFKIGIKPYTWGGRLVYTTDRNITWNFSIISNFWSEPTSNREGTYECNNGELILHDTKNKQKFSTKNKKWIGENESFESVQTQQTPTTDSSKSSTNDIENIKKFQTFLDKNYPGWHNGGTLDNSVEKGWGVFGPRTKQMWNIPKIKSEFEKS